MRWKMFRNRALCSTMLSSQSDPAARPRTTPGNTATAKASTSRGSFSVVIRSFSIPQPSSAYFGAEVPSCADTSFAAHRRQGCAVKRLTSRILCVTGCHLSITILWSTENFRATSSRSGQVQPLLRSCKAVRMPVHGRDFRPKNSILRHLLPVGSDLIRHRYPIIELDVAPLILFGAFEHAFSSTGSMPSEA